MSRITKLPMASSKENRPGLLNRAPTISAVTKALRVNGTFISNNKKLRLRTVESNVSNVVAAAKRPAPSVAAVRPVPAKQMRKDAKPKPVPKITSEFDYKRLYENLLEKHAELKQQYKELLDEREAEVGQLTADLEAKTEENERAKAELRRRTDLLAQVSVRLERKICEGERTKAELRRRTDLLAQVSVALEKKTYELERLERDYAELEREKSVRTHAEWLQNMLSTKGNIPVYCRVRPALPSEADRPLFNVNFVDACSVEVEKVELNAATASMHKGCQTQGFTFDGVFTPHISQSEVFAEVAPLVQSALDGYNVCIFAYGQTGSGKTYTMEGGAGEEHHGIIPRTFDMIFTYAEDLRGMGWELTVVVSFLEIFNENIYDLLDQSKEREHHEIKMSDARGGEVYVTNLCEQEVHSSQELMGHLMVAQRNRATAATVNKERSSRSHTVTRVRISAVNERREEKFTSNLNLVDLAGSESGETTQRMTETCNINKSLSELKNVILALRDNASHMPYRSSKLTNLLMPSLGGNSKALMLVNVCQLEECFGETLNSLRFAVQVNNCRTVKAKKNINVVDT